MRRVDSSNYNRNSSKTRARLITGRNDYLPDGETRGLVKLKPQFVKNKSKDDFTHIPIPKITVPHNESQVKVMSDYELWRVLTFPVNIRRNLITPVKHQIDAME